MIFSCYNVDTYIYGSVYIHSRNKMNQNIICSQCNVSMINTDGEKRKHMNIYHPEVMAEITLLTQSMMLDNPQTRFEVIHSVDELKNE